MWQYMAHSATFAFRIGNRTLSQSGIAGMVVNPPINLDDLPLERRDDLDLLIYTVVTNTALFLSVYHVIISFQRRYTAMDNVK